MAKKILSVLETAHRATLEEQDDTVLWLTLAMRAAGAEMTVVLRGNAVGYAVRGQDASGLAFGERRQTNPPRLDEDVGKLAARGVAVLVVEEDLATRGLERGDLVESVRLIPRASIGKLAAAHDQVWHW
jgi:intracellular sulfur oxidation DsrE/DsrF family protein